MTPAALPLLTALCAASVAAGCGTASHEVEPDASASTARSAPRRAVDLSDQPVVGTRAPLAWGGKLAERCRAVEPYMRAAAAEHLVDIGLIAGIIRVESSFIPDAESRAGALGLMQVMPSNGDKLDCGDLTDPEDNIECGLEVLKRFLKYYDQNIIYALSAYHSGYRRPNRARAAGVLPPDAGYVERVLSARATYLREGCSP